MAKNGRPRRTLMGRFAPSLRRLSPQYQLRPQWWNWTGLKRAIDSRIVSHASDPLAPESVRGLRYFWLDGVFASLSDNLLVSFLGLFALAYGATNGQIGMLTAVANLFAVVALLPGAVHADRTPRRKRLVIWTGGIWGRALILPLVLIPYFNTGASTAIVLIILINGARNFFNSYANPAWTGLVADLVPIERRSKYFAERNFTMGLAALAVSVLGGVTVRRLAPVSPDGMLGYQAVFAAALLFGVASTVAFARIPEPGSAVVETRTQKPVPIRKALRSHPEFVAFLVGALIWNLCIQMGAPFFNVYLVTELGGTAETVGLAAGVVMVAGLAGQIVFGNFSHRKGNMFAIILSAPLIPLMPILWGLASQSWHAYVVSAVGGFAWAGFNLANFNLLLELVPAEARSKSVAMYQAVVFSAAVAGPIIGGILIDLYSYRPVFIGTGLGRFLGVGLFIYLVVRFKSHRVGAP